MLKRQVTVLGLLEHEILRARIHPETLRLLIVKVYSQEAIKDYMGSIIFALNI